MTEDIGRRLGSYLTNPSGPPAPLGLCRGHTSPAECRLSLELRRQVQSWTPSDPAMIGTRFVQWQFLGKSSSDSGLPLLGSGNVGGGQTWSHRRMAAICMAAGLRSTRTGSSSGLPPRDSRYRCKARGAHNPCDCCHHRQPDRLRPSRGRGAVPAHAVLWP